MDCWGGAASKQLTPMVGRAKDDRMRFRPFCLGVGLASAATIGLELTLTRIFSVTMYYHFAFMVISVAMLGLSVAGVSIYLFPKLFERREPLAAAVFMLAFAVLVPWTLKTTLANPLSLDHWRQNLGRLGLLYAAAGLSMLSSGFAISLAIASARERIGTVYACDLVGAALGCVLVIPTLGGLGGPGAVIVCGALGALAAVSFALSAEGPRVPRRVLAGLGAVGALALFALGAGEGSAHRFGAARNPEKFLGNRKVELERWNSFSQITVTPAPPRDHKWIFIDADAATRIWSGNIKQAGWQAPRRFGEVRVAALAYAIRHDGTALIIGPGGGTDVISALAHGAPRVVGVEVNPIIVNDVMKGRYRDYAGDLYHDPRVQVVVDEGRSYIRRSGELYRTIQATLVDTWAASSSGAFTLSENNIYTVEALEEFLGHLGPGGIVVITRWYDPSRPKEFLRLLALGRAALERRGVPPSEVYRHFVVATDRERRATMLLGRDPLAPADLTALAEQATRDNLDFLFYPAAPSGPVVREDHLLASFLRAPSADRFLAGLSYDSSATTDDRPFFFYTLRHTDLFSLLRKLGSIEVGDLGVAILLVLLVFAAALTLLLVVLPLAVLERRALREERRAKVKVLGYFLCLGLGFILVEIGFMQNFVLFLGHPIYALAVVLASLLLSSGVGSALSDRGTARWGTAGYVRRTVGVLAGVLALYGLGLTPLFHLILGIPLGARIAIATVLVAVPGLLMGMLLPSGVRVANGLGTGVVPWGWGLNGSASVVGSILAIMLSMNFGFRAALFVGIAVYLLGAALLTATARPRATGTPLMQ
jgi:SAM-dependent methyltransferase